MLNYMMEDTNTNVIKRVMTCVVQLYKLALMVKDYYFASFVSMNAV